ncbi:MAG TPA: hypothetical protein PLT27_10885 [Nitrospira sp.]|nr:hypothetical protein [Nitrospira sp.]
MSNPIRASAYVQRLSREIEEIQQRIAELTAERHALERQLTKAHWEASALHDVSRKNSGTRIMVEQRIIEALENAKSPLGNSELFTAAKKANIDLKPTTFRTYLGRMNERGIITHAGERGQWMLPPDNAES